MSYEPEMVEFAFADDIVLKATRFDAEHPSVGTQHKHTRDHISVVLGPFAVQIGDPVGVRDDAPVALIGGPGQPADDAIDLRALIAAFRRRLGLFIAVAAAVCLIVLLYFLLGQAGGVNLHTPIFRRY